ncbi:MAG: tRNA glutamyl-Q(34) synthetase GluQRS [Gammaproteobacteria bacterium]|nr:tRNA glutamyl-Q(34) synthetase GluQRS [Gammaproteobacteria bacterium]NNC98057.1 tRNA glutamyl-Q(34) synthetase GluQRS [Gammaproteobacteria bacterium]NNM14607.1 tRNA glutamyl-Q(34) synthetase GluQRS [Gammaproteobacteria bacterium]
MTTSKGQIYRGRFAPSPSGPLHFGSLLAALGSFLQARVQQGKWLVRIEDLDPPREIPGADKLILNSLETHGLHWDEALMYQSQRSEAYEHTLQELHKQGLLFYCDCSNKQIRARQNSEKLERSLLASGVYPGTCRSQTEHRENCGIRLRVSDQILMFKDRVYGLEAQDLKNEVGDFVLKRRDGLYAYQLAVVVDDIAQNITEIVRGVDLLDSTPRQLYLYQCLGASPPDYLHLPLALSPDKKKLSKQTGAKALDDKNAARNLTDALVVLGQAPPKHLHQESVKSILDWAISHWNVSSIPSQSTVI